LSASLLANKILTRSFAKHVFDMTSRLVRLSASHGPNGHRYV